MRITCAGPQATVNKTAAIPASSLLAVMFFGDCMKISEIIEQLEIVKYHEGDIECLIEVVDGDIVSLQGVGEISCEDREGFGPSVCFIV